MLVPRAASLGVANGDDFGGGARAAEGQTHRLTHAATSNLLIAKDPAQSALRIGEVDCDVAQGAVHEDRLGHLNLVRRIDAAATAFGYECVTKTVYLVVLPLVALR